MRKICISVSLFRDSLRKETTLGKSKNLRDNKFSLTDPRCMCTSNLFVKQRFFPGVLSGRILRLQYISQKYQCTVSEFCRY